MAMQKMSKDELRKEFGPFPELTFEENEEILEARSWGYWSQYPAYPDAEAQARATLKGARNYLRREADRIKAAQNPST
jgi:hypothetical protein